MSLRIFNGVLCLLHLALGIGFAAYFVSVDRRYPNNAVRGIELSVRQHTAEIASDRTPSWRSEAVATPRIQDIQATLVAFFLITALFHGIYWATAAGGYRRAIAAGNNRLRWVEYGLTSTLMIWIIAELAGVKDEGALTLIVACNLGMIAQGQLVEEAVAQNRAWQLPLITGFVLLAAEFAVITRAFTSRIAEVRAYADRTGGAIRVPPWIEAMIAVLFVFYGLFGAVSLYGAWARPPYARVETAYLVLSLVSKAALGGFLAYGTSQRQRSSNPPQPAGARHKIP